MARIYDYVAHLFVYAHQVPDTPRTHIFHGLQGDEEYNIYI